MFRLYFFFFLLFFFFFLRHLLLKVGYVVKHDDNFSYFTHTLKASFLVTCSIFLTAVHSQAVVLSVCATAQKGRSHERNARVGVLKAAEMMPVWVQIVRCAADLISFSLPQHTLCFKMITKEKMNF